MISPVAQDGVPPNFLLEEENRAPGHEGVPCTPSRVRRHPSACYRRVTHETFNRFVDTVVPRAFPSHLSWAEVGWPIASPPYLTAEAGWNPSPCQLLALRYNRKACLKNRRLTWSSAMVASTVNAAVTGLNMLTITLAGMLTTSMIGTMNEKNQPIG